MGEPAKSLGEWQVDKMTKTLLNTVFSPVKIFSHMDRMYDWWNGKNIYPITVEIGISGPGNCNNKCNFCMHRSYYDAKAMMDYDFYEDIAIELKQSDVKGIIFSGSGEPLVHPDVKDFISCAASLGMDVGLVTNGTGLRKEGVIEKIIANVAWTRISLDAGTAWTRAHIHGVPEEDFDHVLDSLTFLAREKEKTGSSCQIGAQMVVTKENWGEIRMATEKAMATGIDYFQIKPVVFHPEDKKPQVCQKFWENIMPNIGLIKQLYEDDSFKVFIKYDQFEAIMAPDHEKSAYEKCRATFFPIIEATGKVYHCSQTRGLPEFELGDLHKESFKDIWNSERRKEVIDSIDVSKCQPVCRCHWLNKMLKTVALGENAPSFV